MLQLFFIFLWPRGIDWYQLQYHMSHQKYFNTGETYFFSFLKKWRGWSLNSSRNFYDIWLIFQLQNCLEKWKMDVWRRKKYSGNPEEFSYLMICNTWPHNPWFLWTNGISKKFNRYYMVWNNRVHIVKMKNASKTCFSRIINIKNASNTWFLIL